MREISFVKRLKFNFAGSVTKRALVIGDADNDQRNELVCANIQGDLAIFKERNSERYAYATNLSMVTACLIGDIINSGKNYVAAINTEGWLFIFDTSKFNPRGSSSTPVGEPTSPGQESLNRRSESRSENSSTGLELCPLYDQRMPANCKELLLADLDGDGQNELIIGLTDRVLRTYKWIKIGPDKGKFVGLYKWEFADQIGSVSLNASRHENCQDIIVAQPGGTYAKLECVDKKPQPNSLTASNGSSDSLREDLSYNVIGQQSSSGGNSTDGENVKTEYISKLTPEYHQLALSQMRNHHISTEVLGGIRDSRNSNSYSLIVIATLDGTLMLVHKDEILWSLQVDHQLFALSVFHTTTKTEPMLSQSESTCTIVPNGDFLSRTSKLDRSDNIQQFYVACAWNGKTYMIDEERNYLRFKFDEAVSAFTAGNYYFDGKERSSLVYATFNNQIILYYDIVSDPIKPVYLTKELTSNPDLCDILGKLETIIRTLNISDELGNDSQFQGRSLGENSCDKSLRSILQNILYSINDDEINA